MGQYLPLVFLIILASGFAGISFLTARLFNPPKRNAAKISPYECGVVDQEDPPERFPVRFYLIAMIFIVFDIEIIFFYPFTTVYQRLGGYGIAVIAIFTFAVFESFLYLIGNGALNWGPAKRNMRPDAMVDASRTSTSTVRRVGTEGRGAPKSDTEVAA